MGNPVSYTVAGVAAATGLAGAAAAAVITDEENTAAPPSPESSSPSPSTESEAPKVVLKRRATNSTPRTIIEHTDSGDVEVAKTTKLGSFASGFLGASLAETITLPLDTGKVRMQLDAKAEFISPVHALRHIMKHEGISVLWGGLPAGILRAGLMYSVRLSSYDPMLERVSKYLAGGDPEDAERAKLWVSSKLLTAIPCSALSVCVANPADVLKVRFQKNASSYKHSSISPVTVKDIVMREGFFAGLYSGFLPNVTRNCAVGGAELVGYYQSKEILMNSIGMDDATPAHIVASFGAALSAMLIGSPFDVLGTRLMQREAVAEGKGLVSFTRDILEKEGIRGFYKGGTINLTRLWGFNLVLWLGYENVQRAVKEWGL